MQHYCEQITNASPSPKCYAFVPAAKTLSHLSKSYHMILSLLSFLSLYFSLVSQAHLGDLGLNSIFGPTLKGPLASPQT